MNQEEVLKGDVKAFWNSTPCGTHLAKEKEASMAYFRRLEELRYRKFPYNYSYLIKKVGFNNCKGKKVLEIGCGVGTDSVQFARGGAIVTGIDLTPSAIEIAKKRFKLFGLKGDLRVSDAENLPFENNRFDLVYSFGVLHHTPDTQKAINEVYRVLKVGGKAFVMFYHKKSFEYIALLAKGIIHPANWGHSIQDIVNYETELNKNKNGPSNPLTQMFTRREARFMFRKFSNVKTSIHWLRIPILGRLILPQFIYPLGRLFGWHIIIEAKK